MGERRGPFWDFLAGRVPAPPAAELLGWRLLEIDPDHGTIRVEFQARREFLNPLGTVQGGFLAAMLDDTMGPALVATLEPDQFAPTVELKINFTRPIVREVGPLRCEAKAIHLGSRTATAEGRIVDRAGKLYAHGTTTCIVSHPSLDVRGGRRRRGARP